MSRLSLAVAVLLSVGCAQQQIEPAKLPEKQPLERPPALELTGPGGVVSIGGTLEDAKRAFPPPKDAEVIDGVSFFADLGLTGWTWGYGEGSGFEVAVRDGRIVALAHTELDGPAPVDAVDEQKRLIGEPTRMADGKTTAMLVWEHEGFARFYVVIKGGHPFYGAGSLTVIGETGLLEKRGYVASDPQGYVERSDAAAEEIAAGEKRPK